jgi:uroporphyrinogen-III synthase
VRVACIGPITKETAERVGLTVDIMPEQYTIPAFAEAIVNYYKASPQ